MTDKLDPAAPQVPASVSQHDHEEDPSRGDSVPGSAAWGSTAATDKGSSATTANLYVALLDCGCCEGAAKDFDPTVMEWIDSGLAVKRVSFTEWRTRYMPGFLSCPHQADAPPLQEQVQASVSLHERLLEHARLIQEWREDDSARPGCIDLTCEAEELLREAAAALEPASVSPRFVCPDCGPVVVQEDGTCKHCGVDTVVTDVLRPAPASVSQRDLLVKLQETLCPYIDHARGCSMNVNAANPDGDYCDCRVREATNRANTIAEQLLAAFQGQVPASVSPEGWQPIETVPRCDYVLVWNGVVTIACYHPADGGTWLFHAQKLSDTPTHWMPLPAPPGDAPRVAAPAEPEE